jgi:hypothetical protein
MENKTSSAYFKNIKIEPSTHKKFKEFCSKNDHYMVGLLNAIVLDFLNNPDDFFTKRKTDNEIAQYHESRFQKRLLNLLNKLNDE